MNTASTVKLDSSPPPELETNHEICRELESMYSNGVWSVDLLPVPQCEWCDKYKNKEDTTVMQSDELSTLNCTQTRGERERVCGIVLFRGF